MSERIGKLIVIVLTVVLMVSGLFNNIPSVEAVTEPPGKEKQVQTSAYEPHRTELPQRQTAQEPETTEEPVKEERKPVGYAVIQVSTLNVRNSNHGNIITTVPKNEQYDVYEELDGLYGILLPDGRYGYIFGKYADYYDTEGNLISKADPPKPTPAPTPVPTPVPPQTSTTPVTQPTPAPVSLQEMTNEQLADYVISQCITSDMDAFQMAEAVDAYLCAHMEYDINYYTIKDAIANNRGRCQGYANAFKCIMERLGIPTVYVRGTANGGNHAWNRSEINGVYYYTDVCWNDEGSNSTKRYLLISYEEMSKEHYERQVLAGYNE